MCSGGGEAEYTETVTAADSLCARLSLRQTVCVCVYIDSLCACECIYTPTQTECCSVVVGTGERMCYALFDYHSSLVQMLCAPLARKPLSYPQLMGGHIARWTRHALKGCLGIFRGGGGRVTLWEWGTRSGGGICLHRPTPPKKLQ